MQAALLCATCTLPLRFKVPELQSGRWFVRCADCGHNTALKAELNEPGELASFSAIGVFSVAKTA
ncbi:MAG: hypothetical protein IH604_13150 [Burkholderiales bacterium]|nr:hypothetical protein [Burkholderiales bacterium]